MTDSRLSTTAPPSLFRNSSFLRLWAAQTLAMTVVYGLSMAGVVVIEEQTRSSTQTGLVIISSILPGFLASLVAGAVVDRFGRLPVLVISHLARALVALAFWGGTQLDSPTLILVTVYVVNATGIAMSQFATASEMAMLPDLVGSARLLSANSLLGFSLLVAEGLGIVVVAPLVIKLGGAPAMGAVSTVLYLLALILVATLRRSPATVGGAGPGQRRWPGWATFRSDIRAGWRTIAHDRLLTLVIAQVTLAGVLLLVLLSLVPGLLSRHLGMGIENGPFLVLPGGIGFVMGLFLVGRLERRLSRSVWIAAGLIGLGTSIVLLAMSSSQGGASSLWFIVLLIVGVGLSLAAVIIPSRTILQERPPAEMRGRVVAAQLALGNAVAVVPLLLGGALADWLGIQPVIGLLGLVAVSAGAVGLHYARS
jgi:MFS family permease